MKWGRIVSGGCAAIGILCSLGGLGCRGEADQPHEAVTTSVRTARVQRGKILDLILLTGRAVPPADRDASLAPLVTGRILSVAVREGDRVVKGQRLARLDPASFDDAVAASLATERRAVADAEFRQREAERTRSLEERGVASRQNAESDAAAAVAAESVRVEAASALAEARRKRSWADITAPFEGIVLHVFRSAGEQVDGTPATPILEVAATSPIEIAADATAATLIRLKPGDPAEVSTPDGNAAPFPARVSRLARSVDPKLGVGEVRLALADPEVPLLPGTAVDVRIVAASHDAAILVPSAAIRRTGDGATEVVLVEAGKARARPVRTGITDADTVEVLDGLSGGEEVVVDDPVGLPDGTAVSVRP